MKITAGMLIITKSRPFFEIFNEMLPFLYSDDFFTVIQTSTAI